jgi:hypothetical protein
MKATYTKLIKKIESTEQTLESLRDELEEMDRELASKVKAVTVGKTTTLTTGNRVVKAVSKTFGRGARGYQITENGKVIGREYRGSIYGLKIQLALGDKKIDFFG